MNIYVYLRNDKRYKGPIIHMEKKQFDECFGHEIQGVPFEQFKICRQQVFQILN